MPEVLPKRFARFGLRLHPVKTRLVHSVPPDRERAGEAHSFDLLGFTHYWGAVAEWAVGDQAQDLQGPVAEGVETGQGLVPRAPSRPRPSAIRDLESEAARALWLLRDHRQSAGAVSVPHGTDPPLGEVARAEVAEAPDLACGDPDAPASAPAGTAVVESRRRLANVYNRGAGCVNRARPDLWGASSGFRAGLPDAPTPGVPFTSGLVMHGGWHVEAQSEPLSRPGWPAIAFVVPSLNNGNRTDIDVR